MFGYNTCYSPNNIHFLLSFSLPAPGLAPALAHTLRPTETILPGTIRTTEEGSEATTEASGGPTTTVPETEAITHAAITRTGEEAATAISPTGRAVVVVAAAVVAVAAVAVAAVEAGTIATTTRTTMRTAPGGAAHAPARPRSARAAGAAPTTPTARPRGDLGAPSTPATPRGPGPRRRIMAAARASPAPRMLRTS